MRTVPGGEFGPLGTFLLNTTACPPIRHLLTITPKTGSIVRWTDHEQDLVVGGNTFLHGGEGTTNPAPKVGRLRQSYGVEETDRLALMLFTVNGALFNGVSLPLFAAQRGFDGAIAKIERLYIPPSGGLASLGAMWWWEGPVGMVRPSSVQVDLEVESAIALLNVMLPRIVYQPGCVHMLYDAECTLVRASFTTTAVPVAASPAPTTSSFDSGAPFTWPAAAQVTDYYRLGVITFTSGVNSGLSRGVRLDTWTGGAGAHHSFTLDRPLPTAPAAGDQFGIYPGCDKQQATCTNKFANLVHFRAFPYVPKPETAG